MKNDRMSIDKQHEEYSYFDEIIVKFLTENCIFF